MNHDKLERKNIIFHLEGQLKKGFPRKVMNDQLIKEISEKTAVSNAWIIKMEVPVDMSGDCNQAMNWIQSRIFNFIEKGFHHLGTEAAIKDVSIDGKKQEVPFWFIHVIHPEYKDPRECVTKCVSFEQSS
jgi:hypothetical protein